MPVALEQFVKQLADSGIVPAGDLDRCRTVSFDAGQLARQLVARQHLTDFQAKEFLRGKASSLVLGNYILLDKIGAGGMGQVFKARHRRMDRIVAIKLLPERMMEDRAWIARFEREVQAAAKLSHPNIVAAYDADEFNGIYFLAMEYVEGKDLSTLIRERGPLQYMKAVKAILQVAKGLEFAHSKGVVHRDIKPANLLLDTQGAVRILDMGLARIETNGEALTQDDLTGTGATVGTVSYMAPEQALNARRADARADIYSLGCTLFFLVTGKAPYEGESLMATLLAHREAPIPSLAAAQPDVPPQLDAVFHQMMAKQVEHRYQTMTEVMSALKQVLAGPAPSPEVRRPNAANSGTESIAYLETIPNAPVHRSNLTRSPRQAASALRSSKRPARFWPTVAGGLLGLVLFAAWLSGVLKVKTPHGTIVVENVPQDAEVFVDGTRITLDWPGLGKPLEISAPAGKHQIEVKRDGFRTFGKELTIQAGGSKEIAVRLEPFVATASPTEADIGAAGSLAPKPAAPPATEPDLAASKVAGAASSEIDTGAASPATPPEAEPDAADSPVVHVPPVETDTGVVSPAPAEPVAPPTKQYGLITSRVSGMKLKLIPAGEFQMGSSSSEDRDAQETEMPRHRVRITRPFYMGTTEVTQGQYRAVTGQSPSHFQGSDDLPVEQVSWRDAIDFCNQLSRKESLPLFYKVQGNKVEVRDWKGTGYRLPTEAEREYACRAGSATRFSFGKDATDLADYGWYNENSGWQTHPVGLKLANPFGLFDMQGNVWEWCWDGYAADYYAQSPVDDPTGPANAQHRVDRGGSWRDVSFDDRSASRFGLTPEFRINNLGFRVARSKPR